MNKLDKAFVKYFKKQEFHGHLTSEYIMGLVNSPIPGETLALYKAFCAGQKANIKKLNNYIKNIGED